MEKTSSGTKKEPSYKVYKNAKSGYLLNYFLKNKKKRISKWLHYFDIYESYFSKYRNKRINMLEIGVLEGGSLQMWKSYFGSKANLYGMDINPACKKLEEKGIKILIGDQADRTFLRKIRSELPKLDIILDDGGHTMKQQIATFEELYPHLKEDGIYMCEDLQTSYCPSSEGATKERGHL